ncbi:hypothetical protein [Bradyrhizobium liaoningense]|uniref:hypothetical protein n=1 Tax=Bradyrhizobium liaoningense TaxID=43992 RepID=UPI001FE67932|nr:hypothetical protein [Bradyrhizobium liaoningense]
MDEEHLAAALRYVSLYPVRARLVARAQDWRCSSTRAHLRGKDDGVTATGADPRSFLQSLPICWRPNRKTICSTPAFSREHRPVARKQALSCPSRTSDRARPEAPKRGPKPSAEEGGI